MVLSLIGFLVALLVALPCAGSARAATPVPASAAAPTASGSAASGSAAAAEAAHPAKAHSAKARSGHAAEANVEPQEPVQPFLCTVSGSDRRPGDGCSNHPFSGQESQLPNAPPQPGKAEPPLLVTAGPAPALRPADTDRWPATTPDLHLLQVNRT
ncbi:hypothetical protein GCM10010442_03730 [Kitasatospora kifunensis]